MPRKRRTFSPEYKVEVAELVRSSDKSLARIASDLDLTVSSVRRWVADAEAADENSRELGLDDRAELKRLRRENAQLKMERDFLKKAAAFFAKESK